MKKSIQLILVSMLIALLSAGSLCAELSEDNEITEATSVYDLQKNWLAQVEYFSTNHGVFGYNAAEKKGGLFWPRGYAHQYVYASGIWFGAQKWDPNINELRKMVSITYNPNNGKSWYVPGTVADGDTVMLEDIQKYRVFKSEDFNFNTGESLEELTNWPIWKQGNSDEVGKYIFNEENRNLEANPKGPSMISDENIVSICKDTDLRRYDGGVEYRKGQGYPLGLEIEQRLYGWRNKEMHDHVIATYIIRNTSKDTLWNCALGFLGDIDIVFTPSSLASLAVSNDFLDYYEEDASLNLAYGWTNGRFDEAGRGFGYIGCSLVETPIVDKYGFLKQATNKSDIDKQIGLTTFKNWNIENDYQEDETRYDLMTSGIIDGNEGSGDIRLLLATHGFHFLPNEEVRFSIIYTLAAPLYYGNADGSFADISGLKDKNAPSESADPESLIGKVVYARDFYYNNIFPTFVDEERISEEISINTIAPNPTSGQFDFSFEVVTTASTEIVLYDQFGRPILQLWSGVAKQGINTLNLNIDSEEISTGMYFIKVKQGRDIRVGKIIVK
jgi:type IX secretion system substrate protein